MAEIKDEKNSYDIEMGRFQIFFLKKYHILSIINDLTLGLWFLVGSFLFLFESTQTAGTILFIVGSAQLMGRPVLKLIRAFYVKKGRGDNQPE